MPSPGTQQGVLAVGGALGGRQEVVVRVPQGPDQGHEAQPEADRQGAQETGALLPGELFAGRSQRRIEGHAGPLKELERRHAPRHHETPRRSEPYGARSRR